MAEQQTGDPGRTPGSAEGDAETIEQDLKEKGLDQENDSSSAGQQSNRQLDSASSAKNDKASDE